MNVEGGSVEHLVEETNERKEGGRDAGAGRKSKVESGRQGGGGA